MEVTDIPNGIKRFSGLRSHALRGSLFLAVSLFVFLGFPVGQGSRTEGATPLPVVSLVSLIARPERYDGQRVVVRGYGIFGFEDSYLYLSPYDAQYRVDQNAIFLQPKGQLQKWRSFDHQTIEVEGTFHFPKNTRSGGYWTNYPNGYIGEITRLQLWQLPRP